nr:hypothetical protein [Tanacetum cinerariifolium]
MNSSNASINPFKKIKLTIIPSRQLFVHICSDEDVTTTHSPTITSSSPTPPIFDGALGGVGDEEVIVGECVVVTSSSLQMWTNSCLEGIMVSLIFLKGLMEALEEFMVKLFEEDDKM